MFTGSLAPVSNKEDWIETFKVYDDDASDDPVDLSTATEIEVEIRERGSRTALESATLTGGTVTHIETGVFQWAFTAAQMETLCAGTYDVKIRITIDDIVTQLVVGSLPVLEG